MSDVLGQCVDGPERVVSTEAIKHELGSTLGLDAKEAHKRHGADVVPSPMPRSTITSTTTVGIVRANWLEPPGEDP
jgi:hypothetical protein